MATVKKVDAVTKFEEMVVEPEEVTLTLSLEEAAGLRTLLYCGTHVETLAKLDLDDISGALASTGVVELHENYRGKQFSRPLAIIIGY